MSKRTKQVQVVAPVAPVVTEPQAAPVVQVAKNSGVILQATEKAVKLRAGKNKDAWESIAAILPATVAQLAALPLVQACNVGDKNPGFSMVMYLQRRGYLAPVVTQQ